MDRTSIGKAGAGIRWAVLMAAAGMAATAAQAQNLPITPGQRATAEQVAQAGVALSDLAPDAPDGYTVKSGDTLWAISKLFLKSPWRWPELWGMNLQDIRNPHRIYPGQQLVLDKSGGRARLRLAQAGGATAQPGAAPSEAPIPTVRLSPRIRAEGLPDTVIPPIKSSLIDPFLDEPLIVDAATLEQAARLVAAPEGRVLLSRGDRAYARGTKQALELKNTTGGNDFRVFRNARALRDPVTRTVLGYEAQFVGKVRLVRSESSRPVDGSKDPMAVPATVDVVMAKEEMRAGDRLLPEPASSSRNYVPHAPKSPVEGAIVSVYGSAVSNAAQNQIVVINRGTADGIESGHVLAIQKAGARVKDATSADRRTIQLPDERNGLLMVFRPFERLSYALVLETADGVEVGDRLTQPR